MAKLSDRINPTARDWLLVEEWARARIAEHQLLINSPRVGWEQTQALRGQIMQLNELLALANPPTPETASDGTKKPPLEPPDY